jgi:cytochrome c5
MNRRRSLIRHLTIVLLTSLCLASPLVAQEGRTLEAEDAEIVAWRERYLALGKDVFNWACASCHATGDGNAPQLGDRNNWSDRSPLWSAVLLEHAREGYLEMPAKGGHPYLSDRAVQAAGEYMLGVTFPEKPAD